MSSSKILKTLKTKPCLTVFPAKDPRITMYGSSADDLSSYITYMMDCCFDLVLEKHDHLLPWSNVMHMPQVFKRHQLIWGLL